MSATGRKGCLGAPEPQGNPAALRQEIERLLLAGYSPACLLLGDGPEILDTFGAVDLYVEVDDLPSRLSDAAPRDLHPVLAALLERQKKSGEAVLKGSAFVGESGHRRSITLSLRRLDSEAGLWLLVFEDPDYRSALGERETPGWRAELPVAAAPRPTFAPVPLPAPAPAPPASARAASVAVPVPATVPVKKGNTGAVARIGKTADGGAPERRILMVESHLEATEGLRLLLELRGYEVLMAHEGKAGLAKAKQFRPAVILCGLTLPGSVDGAKFARAVREDRELKETCLVALTGAGQDKSSRSTPAGFDASLPKPVEPRALIQLLKELPRRTS